MTTFTAISNSTILDVALNTYGNLNNVAKLMRDSGHEGFNIYPTNGQKFLFDETLVNAPVVKNLNRNYSYTAGEGQLKYATR